MEFLRKLREPTTWAGIFGLLALVGYSVAPEYQALIRDICTAIISMALILASEPKK